MSAAQFEEHQLKERLHLRKYRKKKRLETIKNGQAEVASSGQLALHTVFTSLWEDREVSADFCSIPHKR